MRTVENTQMDPRGVLGKHQLSRCWPFWRLELCVSEGVDPRRGHFYVWWKSGLWLRKKSALAFAHANGWELVG